MFLKLTPFIQLPIYGFNQLECMNETVENLSSKPLTLFLPIKTLQNVISPASSCTYRPCSHVQLSKRYGLHLLQSSVERQRHSKLCCYLFSFISGIIGLNCICYTIVLVHLKHLLLCIYWLKLTRISNLFTPKQYVTLTFPIINSIFSVIGFKKINEVEQI